MYFFKQFQWSGVDHVCCRHS